MDDIDTREGPAFAKGPIVGAAFGLALLAAATATGSDTVHSLFNLGGLVIVFGGVTSVAFMSFQPDDVRKAMASIIAMLKGVAPGGPESDLQRDMEDIVGWSRIVHELGTRGLEQSLAKHDPADPLVSYGLNLVVSDYAPDDVRAMMETAADGSYQRACVPVEVLRAMGSHAPAFGMVGTLVGMVSMLHGLTSDEGAIGATLAVAFLSTLYGVLSARMIYMPAGSRLERLVEAQVRSGIAWSPRGWSCWPARNPPRSSGTASTRSCSRVPATTSILLTAWPIWDWRRWIAVQWWTGCPTAPASGGQEMKGRRHTSGGQARHPDDWLMTYADTITLLLCLFVVLLALHGAKPHGAVAVGLPPSADTPSSSTLLQTAIVVAPFRELAGIPRPPEDADDDTADRATRQDNLSTRRAVVATALSSGVPALMPTAHSVPKAARVLAASPAEAHRPSTALPPPEAEKPANASAKAAADLKGDRITIFQFSSTAFFASGAAHLSELRQSILESLLDRLQ